MAPYQKLPIGTHQPGFIVILIEQSGSMMSPYGHTLKHEFVSFTVNRCIYEIVNACKSGQIIKDRCHIGVIGYGRKINLLVGGRPSELDKQVKRTQAYRRKVPDGVGGLVQIKWNPPPLTRTKALPNITTH